MHAHSEAHAAKASRYGRTAMMTACQRCRSANDNPVAVSYLCPVAILLSAEELYVDHPLQACTPGYCGAADALTSIQPASVGCMQIKSPMHMHSFVKLTIWLGFPSADSEGLNLSLDLKININRDDRPTLHWSTPPLFDAWLSAIGSVRHARQQLQTRRSVVAGSAMVCCSRHARRGTAAGSGAARQVAELRQRRQAGRQGGPLRATEHRCAMLKCCVTLKGRWLLR